MTPVEQALARIRAVAKDEADKGVRFERMIAHALRTDRTFQQQFTDVWLWMNWPDRTSADVGVDIVARNVDGTFTAIQCKCYDPTTTLTKQDIDSFLATSGKVQFARRIVVATTDLWSSNAEKALEGHAVPVERMGVDDLDAMTVDWSSYDIDNPEGLAETPRHELAPRTTTPLSPPAHDSTATPVSPNHRTLRHSTQLDRRPSWTPRSK